MALAQHHAVAGRLEFWQGWNATPGFAQYWLRPADITRVRKAANQAIDRQAAADVLVQINVGRRNRAFEAPELIDAFTALERQLASPAGDTGE